MINSKRFTAFPIKDIELFIEDEIVEAGELLLDINSTFSVSEIEKNLWVTTLKEGGQSFEVEIQMHYKKVKAYTCDCEMYATHELCPHITATLLWLRKNKTKTAPPKVRKRVSNPTKLTTNNILQNIKHKDLMTFVKQYARTNKAFSIALKARFTSDINFLATEDKYHQLLNSVLSPKKSINHLGKRFLAQIESVIKEVIQQIADQLALDNHAEAFIILKVLFDRLHTISLSKRTDLEPLNGHLNEGLRMLSSITKREIAPQLNFEIWEYGLKAWKDEDYFGHAAKWNLFQILERLAIEKVRKKELLESLLHHMNSIDKEDDHRIMLLVAQMRLHNQLGEEDHVNMLLEEHLSEPLILLSAIAEAKRSEDWTRVLALAKFGESLKMEEALSIQLDETLLEVAKAKKDQPTQKKMAKKLFLKTFQFKYLLSLNLSTQPSLYAQLIEELSDLPYSLNQRDAIAKLHSQSQNQAGLLNYLKEAQSLDLLKAYGASLIHDQKEEVYQLYRDLLAQYLKQHFGKQAANRITDFIFHLKGIRATDLAAELIERFRKEYSDRDSLIQELAQF